MTSKRKKVRRPVGDATMVQQGDERDARLKHQALFLQARGLMSPEMADLKRQLLLLERLTGKGARKLDPRVADRIHGELENATMEQLKATGLVEEWLTAWETRGEIERVITLVPGQKPSLVASQPVGRAPSMTADRKPAPRSVDDALSELEQAVQRFSEQLAESAQTFAEPMPRERN